MTDHNRPEFDLRHTVINHLSDTEVACLINQRNARMEAGEEFLDMERLEHGVQRANDASLRSGPLLNKSCMRASTWQRILAVLAHARGPGSADSPV